MNINKLDYNEKVASLIFSREEIHTLRKAISEYIDNKSGSENKTDLEKDEWLQLQLIGVDDILKDGSFSRFLGYHKRLIELKEETNAENQTN